MVRLCDPPLFRVAEAAARPASRPCGRGGATHPAPLFEECLPTLCPLLKAQSAEGEGEDGEERGEPGGGLINYKI